MIESQFSFASPLSSSYRRVPQQATLRRRDREPNTVPSHPRRPVIYRPCAVSSCRPHYLLVLEGYDGGDCCACTCQVDEDGEGCDEDFACIDPAAACVNDDDITIDVVEACGDIGRLGEASPALFTNQPMVVRVEITEFVFCVEELLVPQTKR